MRDFSESTKTRHPGTLPQDIEVPMGRYAAGKGILTTEGVSTCIYLAAHNALTSTGVLAHISSPTDESLQGRTAKAQMETFERALGALAGIGPREYTKIWMGGASHLTRNDELLSSSQRNRDWAKSRLDQFKFEPENIQIAWLEDDIAADIALDTYAGKLLIEKTTAFRIPENTDPMLRLAHLLGN